VRLDHGDYVFHRHPHCSAWTAAFVQDAHFKPRAKPKAEAKPLQMWGFLGSGEISAGPSLLNFQADRHICT
jgi:hypothetical protein